MGGTRGRSHATFFVFFTSLAMPPDQTQKVERPRGRWVNNELFVIAEKLLT